MTLPAAEPISEPERDTDRLYRFERPAAAPPFPAQLTESNAADYARDGFVAFSDLLSPEEIREARTALDDLIRGRVPEYPGLQPEHDMKPRWETATMDERADLIRKIWRFVDYEPRLKRLAETHAGLHRALECLLGEPAFLIQDMAMLKPPYVGTEKPWHQDMAYFKWGPPEKVIGVWIALDPATADNGCMHVVPGTHREGPVAHAHVRDCQIPDARVAVDRDVYVPLEPGGALFFSSLLHHGTPPNNGPSRRWALQFHYAAKSAVPMDRVEHARLFFEDGLYAGCRGNMGTPVGEMTP